MTDRESYYDSGDGRFVLLSGTQMIIWEMIRFGFSTSASCETYDISY